MELNRVISMQVEHIPEGTKGSFVVKIEDKIMAQMSYVWGGTDKFIIDHTEVDESLKGRGVGRMLVDKTVEFARLRGVKILPLCPFAKSVFNKDVSIQDVL